MSEYETKWERVEEDDPERCQYIGPKGQCRIKSVEQSEYCPAHGGNKAFQSAEKKRLRNYQLTQFRQRAEQLTNSDDILSLREEIGILRMLIEAKINLCEDTHDLLLVAGPLSDLLLKVERVVVSCNRLDMRLGNLLDKGRVLQFAQTIVQIVADEIDDVEILEKISTKILEALE